MVRIGRIQWKRPNLEPTFPASPDKSDDASIGRNRGYLKGSSLAEKLLGLSGTVAADPPDGEVAVAPGNIRDVNNVLCVRGPHRLPVQSGIARKPSECAAFEIVN